MNYLKKFNNLLTNTNKFLKENKLRVERENYKSLAHAITLSLILSVFLFVVSLFPNVNFCKIEVFATSIICLMSFLLLHRLLKNNKVYLKISKYIFLIFIYILALIFFAFSDNLYFGNAFFAITVIVSSIYSITRPFITILVTMAASIIYCIISFLIKEINLFPIDLIILTICIIINFYLSINIFIKKLGEMNFIKEQEILANSDALTDLPNKRTIINKITEIENKSKGEEYGIIMLDIDNFKLYNDIYGHNNGDECLKLVAQVCKNIGTKFDFNVARFGGEEFIVIKQLDDKFKIKDVCETLRRAIYSKNLEHKGNVPYGRLTVSIGFATTNNSKNIVDIINQADEALYMAKSIGKNCVVSADEAYFKKDI